MRDRTGELEVRNEDVPVFHADSSRQRWCSPVLTGTRRREEFCAASCGGYQKNRFIDSRQFLHNSLDQKFLAREMKVEKEAGVLSGLLGQASSINLSNTTLDESVRYPNTSHQ